MVKYLLCLACLLFVFCVVVGNFVAVGNFFVLQSLYNMPSWLRVVGLLVPFLYCRWKLQKLIASEQDNDLELIEFRRWCFKSLVFFMVALLLLGLANIYKFYTNQDDEMLIGLILPTTLLGLMWGMLALQYVIFDAGAYLFKTWKELKPLFYAVMLFCFLGVFVVCFQIAIEFFVYGHKDTILAQSYDLMPPYNLLVALPLFLACASLFTVVAWSRLHSVRIPKIISFKVATGHFFVIGCMSSVVLFVDMLSNFETIDGMLNYSLHAFYPLAVAVIVLIIAMLLPTAKVESVTLFDQDKIKQDMLAKCVYDDVKLSKKLLSPPAIAIYIGCFLTYKIHMSALRMLVYYIYAPELIFGPSVGLFFLVVFVQVAAILVIGGLVKYKYTIPSAVWIMILLFVAYALVMFMSIPRVALRF